jgi:putative RecB family exonuclease
VIDWKAIDRANEYKTRPRSYSQLSSYESCAYAYYLTRIAGVWEKPDGWRPMGTALHSAVEHREKTGDVAGIAEIALEVAQDSYIAAVNKSLAETPNPDAWHRSGPYAGSADIPRRYGKLAEHLDRYEQLRTTLPALVPGGVEAGFDAVFDGVRVIGFIDQVREGLVVDLKTGSTVPKSADQLAVYAEAVRQAGGENITEGAFVITGVGVRGRVIRHDLTTISVESLGSRFRAMDEGVKAAEFEPTPGAPCGRCGVVTSCPVGTEFVAAEKAARRA